MAKKDYSRLSRQLGYTFQDETLLIRALTHRSAGSENNQRLEFLGDAILNFIIAHALFEKFPKEDEGKMSRLRAHLVKGETLAALAHEIALGDALILGPGELRTGGFRRSSSLADALEALFAAIYLDGGLMPVQQVIFKLFETRLQEIDAVQNLKDPKTQLQEFLQSKKMPLPQYVLLSVEGEEHDQIFKVTCTIEATPYYTEGEGASRRKAEQAAAQLLLNRLKHL